MEVRILDRKLVELEVDPSRDGEWPTGIGRAYRKLMMSIRAAVDERDLYAMKSHRFKKWEDKHSMRLNDQWRLILDIEKAEPKNVILVVSIRDYH